MAIKQLSDGNPDGTLVGQDPSDKIAFYGAQPAVQQVLATGATTAQIVAALAALGLTRLT